MRLSVLYSAAKRLSLAGRRLGDVDERSASAAWPAARRRQECRAAMVVVARVVVAQHQCVPQVQIEQRLRRLVVRKAGLRAQRLERCARGVDQPLDVVACRRRCRRGSGSSRRAAVVDDGRDLRIVGQEKVVEQVGQRGAGVAQALQQSDRLRLQSRGS